MALSSSRLTWISGGWNCDDSAKTQPTGRSAGWAGETERHYGTSANRRRTPPRPARSPQDARPGPPAGENKPLARLYAHGQRQRRHDHSPGRIALGNKNLVGKSQDPEKG